MKNDFIGIVTEINILQNHVTFQFNIIRGAFCLVEMLPCPASGTLIGFCENAVFFSGIDKSNITFICFRFFIQEIKDTFGTCKSHNNTVELLADLVDRHVEALVESQEAGKSSKGEIADSVDCQDTSYNSTDYIADISKLSNNRHQDVGETVGVVCTGKKLVV